MSMGTKRAVIISGSPKPGGKSASMRLAGLAAEALKGDGVEAITIDARKSLMGHETIADYKTMLAADALIFIFPLYIFCLPGLLMRFLQDYAQYVAGHRAEAKKPMVYAVVNCGFPEPEINEEAVRVIRSFSEKIGAAFGFGVMIGAGGMLMGAEQAPFMKKTMADIGDAFRRIKNALLTNDPAPQENILTRPNFPRKLYFMGGNMGWYSSARQNGLKRRELYSKPYAEK